MNKTIWIFIVFLLCAYNSNAQVCSQGAVCAPNAEHEDHAGIQLSASALDNYGITTNKPTVGPVQKLPRAAFVYSKDKYFIYEKHGHNFNEIEVFPLSVSDSFITFSDVNYKTNKEYVISGANFLRIIFLNNNAPEAGHGH